MNRSKLIDDICRQLSVDTSRGEWISLEELEEMLIDKNMSDMSVEDARDVMNFMVKHFLETDYTGRKVRLKQCFYKIFGS